MYETRPQVRVQEPRLSASSTGSVQAVGSVALEGTFSLSVRPLITVYLLINYPWFLVFEPERMYK
jgi:hypothetical protein